MESVTLVTLASAAGSMFRKITGTEEYSKETSRKVPAKRSGKHHGTLQKVTSCPDLDTIEELPEYTFVRKLVDAGFPAIFVTGAEGTGKSTLIHWLTHEFSGRVLLAAPTAMTAMAIGGETLHSLCQLPLQWITQSAIRKVPDRLEFQNAGLLIIDEISMVNANLLDGVSRFLKKNREIDKPFGGLSVVLVGDFFQLPPVVKPGLQDFFEKNYGGETKFYAARSLCDTDIRYYGIELKKAFQQKESDFIEVLTAFREGGDKNTALGMMNSRCAITTRPPEGAVVLVPRKSEMEKINRGRLQKILGRLTFFDGCIEGNFSASEFSLPSPMTLEVKVGAQVMFTQDDQKNRWTNGTIGIVESITGADIYVRKLADGEIVKVGKTTWSRYTNKWNPSTKRIETYEEGAYRQYPLILAWALTLHKCQGKILEKVHLDLDSGVFAPGQTYVALSRCRGFEDLSFSRPLKPEDMIMDQESLKFSRHLSNIGAKLPPEQLLQKLSAELSDS